MPKPGGDFGLPNDTGIAASLATESAIDNYNVPRNASMWWNLRALLTLNAVVCDTHSFEGLHMDSTTLLIIILLIVVLFGGGWYGRGRWY
jgi:hypothetical protein